MAMVVVDASCLKQADSQPKSCGLVWGSAAAWRCSTFTRWTKWTLAMTWPWWQHYKYRRGYYYYYYYYSTQQPYKAATKIQYGKLRRWPAPSVARWPARGTAASWVVLWKCCAL